MNNLIPWGSHPDLDPLWSTERTFLRVDGAEVTRTEKVTAIAASPIAPSRLKVCWRADIEANCGRCEKCVRTQCALAIAGALERAPVFLQPLTVRRHYRAAPPRARAPSEGIRPVLARAVRKLSGRSGAGRHSEPLPAAVYQAGTTFRPRAKRAMSPRS